MRGSVVLLFPLPGSWRFLFHKRGLELRWAFHLFLAALLVLLQLPCLAEQEKLGIEEYKREEPANQPALSDLFDDIPSSYSFLSDKSVDQSFVTIKTEELKTLPLMSHLVQDR
jgi:hypothetical protein